MESALYGIYALVFVSEILLVRCAHSFDFWYVNNSCVNTVRQHFPWSILYVALVTNMISQLQENFPLRLLGIIVLISFFELYIRVS